METQERKLIELIATDRIDIPISSISGKLKRRKPKIAQGVYFDGKKYNGERAFAYLDNKDHMKARGVKEGIEKFTENFPKYAKILNGYIEEQRSIRENYLVFGMRDGCIVTADDYIGVMQNLGFTSATAERLYPELMNISRKLKKKRDEGNRKILLEQVI